MEEFVVYILYSERFKSHNYLGTKGFTLKFRPWTVIHVEFFYSKSEAMKREKYFKTGIGREFIQIIIQNL